MNPGGLYVSLLTPAGRGAVASILVRGQGAIELLSRRFSPLSGKTLSSLACGRVVLGTFLSAPHSAEEVVVGLHQPDHVEVHCHGGIYAAEAILESLRQEGAERIPWEEAAHLLEEDLIAAEARIALAAARTEKSAAILLDQYQGALRRYLESAAGSVAKLESLLSTASLGRHLTEPWRVVIAGEPNVGKSSLMNALVGYQRSIVFDQPGTTRDVLSARTALDGWPVELLDTAGLRESDEAIESAGVARAVEQLQQADLVLWVLDATTDPAGKESACAAAQFPAGIPLLQILNKSDLLAVEFRSGNSDGLLVSALTGVGIGSLLDVIARTLVPYPPPRGTALIFTSRQEIRVSQALALLRAGMGDAALATLQSLFAA